MIKQYTVDIAYTGNCRVEKYIDGKCIGKTIITDYNLSGYKTALEEDGFERAYDVDEAMAEVDEAHRRYQEALEWYDFAKKYALVKE